MIPIFSSKRLFLSLLCLSSMCSCVATQYTLYDLSENPAEDVNIAENTQRSTNISNFLEKIDFLWENLYTETQTVDKSTAKKAWKNCGGVCSWLDSNITMTTETKYKSSDAPNIVFVLVDDLGWNDVGFQSTYLSWATPTIDRLASEGVKLTNYFTHATCTPSRGALMTGRYPLRLGLWDEDTDLAELPVDEVTLAQELKSAGYRTYMVGKWHLGMSTSGHWPTSRGFDYFYGLMGDSIDYWTKENEDGYLDLHLGTSLVTSSSELSESMHTGYLFESKAEFVIEHHAEYHAGTPLFLYYSMQLVQGSYSVPDVYSSRCEYPSSEDISDDSVRSKEYTYCGMLVMMDEAIANLTCTLEANGMMNNTLIVITSDNGGDSSIRGNNYPFMGSKGEHYRGGLSVPAVMHGTVIPDSARGSLYEGQAHVTDWLPTLMGLATGGEWQGGLTLATIDGVDMWEAIMTNTESLHDEILHWINGSNSSIQLNMLKLNVNDEVITHLHKPSFVFEADMNSAAARQQCESPSLTGSVVDTDFSSDDTTAAGTDDDDNDDDDALVSASDTYQVFDLRVDPYEQDNVYSSVNSTDTALIAKLIEIAAYYSSDSLRVDPEIPDTTSAASTWAECGGVCSWVSTGEDDDDAATVGHIYNLESAPNIVFVLVDDLGWNDVGFQSTYLSWATPTIDRLASEGVKLTNFFTHATCTPSRGALMTGRYPLRLGLWDEDTDLAELPLDEVTLAQELKSAGYRTYMVGKWHLGMSTSGHWPTSRGFDYFYGLMGDSIDYWTKENEDGYLDLHSGTSLVTSSSELSESMHTGYLFESKAEFVIEHHAEYHAGTPLFLYYSMQLVQGSYSVPDVYSSRCKYPDSKYIADDALQSEEYTYCGMLVMMDEAIANLTCTLEANGMMNNTLIVITSDNGGDAAIPGNSYPFMGSKGEHYRGGLSVPALVHGKLIPDSARGSVYEGQTHVTDWLPTLMGLATGGQWTGGLKGATIDGVDLWSAIMNNTDSPHVEIVHAVDGSTASVQYNMTKFDINPAKAHMHKPAYDFEDDEDEDASRELCYMPSLMYSHEAPPDPMTLIDFYDLRIDPTELSSLVGNESYLEAYESNWASCEAWNQLVLDPEVPDDYEKASVWKECGGVCPWLEDDFEPLVVEQIYSYDSAPHIIFALVDDWGWNDVGWRSTYLNWTTPTIDRMAAEGVKLGNYFTHFSCVPSRAAFLTGRYPIRLGLWGAGEMAELPLDEVLIAHEMKSAGYRTYLVGKWHLGFSTDSHTPTNRGFDYHYGYYNGYVDYWTKEHGNHLDLHEDGSLVTNENELSSSLHNGYLLQAKVESVLESHMATYADQPLFLYYAMQLIHGVWAAPQKFLNRCSYPTSQYMDGYTQDVEYNYCALNVMLDEVMTNLTCTLERLNMTDNTVLVVVSDNGGEPTVNGNNYPFRGAKGSYYRGGLSGTGFIHSKLVSDEMRGATYDGQMHVTDWLPTLMGLATGGEWQGGLTGATIDGVDMWEAIMTNTESPHIEIVHYADGDGSCSYQYNMTKLDIGAIAPPYAPVMFTFTNDLDPSARDTACTAPSLIYNSESSGESGSGRGSTSNRSSSRTSSRPSSTPERTDSTTASSSVESSNEIRSEDSADGGSGGSFEATTKLPNSSEDIAESATSNEESVSALPQSDGPRGSNGVAEVGVGSQSGRGEAVMTGGGGSIGAVQSSAQGYSIFEGNYYSYSTALNWGVALVGVLFVIFWICWSKGQVADSRVAHVRGRGRRGSDEESAYLIPPPAKV